MDNVIIGRYNEKMFINLKVRYEKNIKLTREYVSFGMRSFMR